MQRLRIGCSEAWSFVLGLRCVLCWLLVPWGETSVTVWCFHGVRVLTKALQLFSVQPSAPALGSCVLRCCSSCLHIVIDDECYLCPPKSARLLKSKQLVVVNYFCQMVLIWSFPLAAVLKNGKRGILAGFWFFTIIIIFPSEWFCSATWTL